MAGVKGRIIEESWLGDLIARSPSTDTDYASWQILLHVVLMGDAAESHERKRGAGMKREGGKGREGERERERERDEISKNRRVEE